MLLVASAGVACSIAGSYLASRASSGFGRDLRFAVFSRVGQFSPREFGGWDGVLITRTTNDVQQIQQMFHMSMRMALRALSWQLAAF